MGFQCGIVGLPNVGKSTLFNALTQANIQAENYPFCTIDPHVGVVPVPDLRLQQIDQFVQAKRVVPASMQFVDIAGLVAGASKGEGLGNQFLAHIRETDAIAQVVRCFEDDDIIHVAGKVDPIDDLETIETELLLADMQTLERALQKIAKLGRSGDKQALVQQQLLQSALDKLDQGIPVRQQQLSDEERQQLKLWQLLTAKPMFYIANLAEDEQDPHQNPLLQRLLDRVGDAPVVALSAALEAEISQLDEADKADFLMDYGLTEPGLHRVIRTGYQLLGLLTFFTAGVQEIRAWTTRIGANAPEAAAAIHTDFQRGFIRAEVMAFDDFIRCGGEQATREAGLWRLEGKEYPVKEGDLMHFRFNV